MTRPCAVYRFYDELGSLLYVGIAYAPRLREASHRRKDWWSMVRGTHVEWMPDRQAAHAVEKRAIETEAPRFNVAKGFIPPTTPRLPRPAPLPDHAGDNCFHLVGAAEIATMLQVSRQRVQQLMAEDDFPPPFASLAMGKIWMDVQVHRWARWNDRPVHTFT